MLDPEGFEGGLGAIMDAAAQHGVGHMLCVAVNLEDFPAMLSLVRGQPNLFASVGVHPNEQHGEEPSSQQLVMLAQDPKVIAIGETGLDYFRSQGDLGWQRKRFRTHIAAAITSAKPLIIHCRDAKEDTLRILKEECAERVGGVMHCFTEDWETAKQALDLNFYISFSGIVTFKSAETIRDVARRVPLDRLLVETDAPYLAPVPFRGKTNQPAYVRHVAQHIADLRGISLDEVAQSSTQNFFSLFKQAA
jgi:TatD DNase family protein